MDYGDTWITVTDYGDSALIAALPLQIVPRRITGIDRRPRRVILPPLLHLALLDYGDSLLNALNPLHQPLHHRRSSAKLTAQRVRSRDHLPARRPRSRFVPDDALRGTRPSRM